MGPLRPFSRSLGSFITYLAVLEGLFQEGPIMYFTFVVSKVLEAPALGTEAV
jgi:hypothetical protein